MSLFLDICKDVHVLNFNQLFYEHTYINILNDLYKYNLLDGKIDIEVKRIFYHHVIYDVCEYYLHSKVRGTIVFFNYTQLEDCVLFQYFSEEEVRQIITAAFLKVERLLPIRTYLSKYSATFLQIKYHENDGRALNTVEKLKELSILNEFKGTFEGIKKFTKKYGLLYLNQDYFQRLSTKRLYIK